jgi:ABC-type multidrug transport system fused ATPase/permease subunit
MMANIYQKFLELLDTRSRHRFFLIALTVVIVAISELFSLSSVLILMQILSTPEQMESYKWLNQARTEMGLDDDFNFQISVSIATILIIFSGLIAKSFGRYAILRYAASCGASISARMFEAYLRFPYTWFILRNSSEIKTAVIDDSGRVLSMVLTPLLAMIASSVNSIVIIIFLIIMSPVTTVVSAAIISCFYIGLFYRLKFRLRWLGQQTMAENRARYRAVSEASEGLKELKLLGLESVYSGRFSRPTWRMSRYNAEQQAIGELPRFALEGMAFAVMLGVILTLMLRHDGSLAPAIPTLGTFAFAALRLLPLLQQIYQAMTTVRNGLPALDKLHHDFLEARDQAATQPVPAQATARLRFSRELEIDQLCYAYPNAARTALDRVSLVIPAHTTIGLIGGTGAGKTTLVDLLLGLLQPTAGEIRIDGKRIDRNNMRSWQKNIGYVPQSIYLSDATIAENIAFGLRGDEIDTARIEMAGRMAALHDFVTNELPDGYNTFVGERGVRLSGGQRQRIGIARALYHDPDMLIFDEATSALDTLTEKAVMAAIQNIRGDKTVILIAHRLTTVRNCDAIHMLENGRVVASGTYDYLIETNSTFQRMTAVD